MKLTIFKRYSDRFRYLGLLPAGMLLALPLLAGTARIYITNSAGDMIHVIDPVTNNIIQVIEGIEEPHGVNFSADGSQVYISNESESLLDVLDRKTGSIIKKVALSGHPNNIALTKDGGRLVVCIAEKPGALDIVNTATLEKVKSIPMKDKCHNPYVTPDGKYAVAGSVAGKFLIVVDLKTEQPAWQLDFDNGVRPMAFDKNPDGSTHRIFAQLSHLNGFAVVDFATHQEVARIKFPDDPTGFGVAEGRVVTPSHGIGVAPDGKSLWVASTMGNCVFAYSLPDLKLIGHATLPELKLAGRPPIGAVPEWLTFTPDSKTLYVSNSAARSVSAIDTKTLKEIARIPVGDTPKRINTLVLP
jgi:YVTN family beta-propeller protein